MRAFAPLVFTALPDGMCDAAAAQQIERKGADKVPKPVRSNEKQCRQSATIAVRCFTPS
jgi:hypothetical protein